MLKTIGLREKFSLVFKVKKVQLLKIQLLLNENGLVHHVWQALPFDGYVKFIIDVNLRQAEVVRQLLKHFELHD